VLAEVQSIRFCIKFPVAAATIPVGKGRGNAAVGWVLEAGFWGCGCVGCKGGVEVSHGAKGGSKSKRKKRRPPPQPSPALRAREGTVCCDRSDCGAAASTPPLRAAQGRVGEGCSGCCFSIAATAPKRKPPKKTTERRKPSHTKRSHASAENPIQLRELSGFRLAAFIGHHWAIKLTGNRP